MAPTVVRAPAGVHVFLWTILPAGGAAIGFVLSQLPDWMTRLPRIGNVDVLNGLAEAIGTFSIVTLLVVGAAVGAIAALMAYDDIAEVEVGAEAAVIRRGDDADTVARPAVAGVYVTGKELVLVEAGGTELARVGTELETDELRAAFSAHGWPWRAA